MTPRYEVYVIRPNGPVLDHDKGLQTDDERAAVKHALSVVLAPEAVQAVAVVYDTKEQEALYVASPGRGGIV